MAEKTLLQQRAWLNPKDHCDSGAVHSRVNVDTGDFGCINASLSIWDCGRKITLDFDVYSEKSAVARAKKINILIDHLMQMKAALGKGFQEACESGTFTNNEAED